MVNRRGLLPLSMAPGVVVVLSYAIIQLWRVSIRKSWWKIHVQPALGHSLSRIDMLKQIFWGCVTVVMLVIFPAVIAAAEEWIFKWPTASRWSWGLYAGHGYDINDDPIHVDLSVFEPAIKSCNLSQPFLKERDDYRYDLLLQWERLDLFLLMHDENEALTDHGRLYIWTLLPAMVILFVYCCLRIQKNATASTRNDEAVEAKHRPAY